MSHTEQEYVVIGYTRKAHGLTGELKISIEDRYLEDFLKNERVYIAVKNAKMPFFIANIRGKGEMIVQFEEVDDRDAAQAIQSREIYLRTQDLLADEDREFEVEEDETLVYGYLTGYLLVDQTAGEVGEIAEVLEMPQQEMAMLRYRNREVLIPLNEQFIVSIDREKRQVLTDLPEGLLEV